MAGDAHRFPLHTKVRLKQDRDRSYALAPGGSEGWIRKQKVDYPNVPMVYIEWDINHWRYQGEPPQWTFEDHFEAVEEIQMAEDEGFKIDGDKLIDFLIEQKKSQEGSKTPQEPAREESPSKGFLPTVSANEYDERLVDASTEATHAEGFILISIAKRDIEGHEVHTANLDYAYRTEAAGLLCEAQLATALAEIVRQNASQRLAELQDDEPGR